MNHLQSEVLSAEKSFNQSFSLQERKRDSVIKAILSEDIIRTIKKEQSVKELKMFRGGTKTGT